jgi:hypothetical protein
MAVFNTEADVLFQNDRYHSTKVGEPARLEGDNLSQNSSWQNN